MLPPSLLAQSTAYVQRNDLAYRVFIDTLGFDLPYYYTGRNKYERRENLVALSIAAIMGFLIAPFVLITSNSILAKKYFKGNNAFFKTNFKDIDNPHDPTKVKRVITELEKGKLLLKERFKNPNWIEKTFLKSIQQASENIDQAVTEIKKNPTILNLVFKNKQKSLYFDLIVTTGILASIPYVKNWVSRKFSHKDRFTGSQKYLSDEDLKKMTAGTDKAQQSKIQKILAGATSALPIMVGLLVHKGTKKKIFPYSVHHTLLKIRNALDYDSGIYMKVGTVFICFLPKYLNTLTFSRDKYERLENIIKWSLIVPSWYMGEKIFNGPIAQIADKISQKKYGTAKRTFYQSIEGSNIFVKAKKMQDIVDQNITNPHLREIRRLSITAMYTSLLAHSFIVAASITGTNMLTKKRILRDLKKVKEQESIN